MFPIKKCSVPANTMLSKYLTNGAYVDCYTTEISGQLSFSEFIFAFYTTFLFKLERLILAWMVSKPSTDMEAHELANGLIKRFAAWDTESRSENEILLCDFQGRTRSWLMVLPVDKIAGTPTRLYFGSAVVPIRNPRNGKLSLGLGYQALLGFHKIYSILLLYSAKLKIEAKLMRETPR